jgi:hypothetical protein
MPYGCTLGIKWVKSKQLKSNTMEKEQLLASLLIKIVDENKLSQESAESDEWILGYQEACEMMINYLAKIQNN